MSFYSLIYVSQATRPMSGDDLKAILTKSHENNHKRDVTGILLYHNERFMQVLEGDQGVVQGLYRKISADPRHKAARIVYQRPVKQRTFGEWKMGFRDLGDLATDDLPGYSDFLTKPLDAVSLYKNPDRTMMFLQLFRDQAG